MDFARVELSDEDKAFRDQAREFLKTQVTEEVRRRDRETGDNFDEGVHLAIGAAGYLHGEWHTEHEGWFSRVKRRLPQSFLGRAFLTWFTPGPGSGYVFAVANLGSALLLVLVAIGFGRVLVGPQPTTWVSTSTSAPCSRPPRRSPGKRSRPTCTSSASPRSRPAT